MPVLLLTGPAKFLFTPLALAVAFGGWIWWTMGPQAGLEYYTGFVFDITGGRATY